MGLRTQTRLGGDVVYYPLKPHDFEAKPSITPGEVVFHVLTTNFFVSLSHLILLFASVIR